ncbi:MAG: sugar phosphate nucleotidyltransferase, partial [Treponema sp.]|nr:sugar phosphate nucleotidyltransferase [Treponema sp.]
MFDDCLVMAGGSGARLWPASNALLPKQFLRATERASFFALALERAFALVKKNGRVIVIVGKPHLSHVMAEAEKLGAAQKKRLVALAEPEAKSTAPAVACALALSLLEGGDRKMIVLTSDHLIDPLQAFKDDAAL